MSVDDMKAKKGCWTCKARKIQCDRVLPSCRKCAQAQRECQGYGLRLSWPRDNDKRRAITATSSPGGRCVRERTDARFINATQQDVELHRHLSLQTVKQPPRLVHLSPKLWKQPQSAVKRMDLVQYFHEAGHFSLPTFNPKTSHMRDSLLRMALANDSVSGHALFYALLAVSSVGRSGPHLEAIQLKVSALQTLSASARGGSLSSVEAAQHVATCMLLGTFEILSPSESSGEWLWYVRGAMDIIQGAGLEQQSNQSDIGNLLDWVYYHDALSRFTTHHWRHKSVTPEAKNANRSGPLYMQYPPLTKGRPALRSPNPAHAILNLLSEACDTLIDPSDPKSQDQEYKDRLIALEESINNVSISTVALAGVDDEISISVEIYRLTTLIYLVRASRGTWESPAMLNSLIEKAFAVPLHAPSCDHFFPMFILGCEARTDEQRNSILDLIERTEKGARVRSMNGLKAEIKRVWVQQDLYSDSELLINYFDLMNAVISSNNTPPSYV